MKQLIMLTFLSWAVQAREYHYQKPLKVFHNEEGHQPQYVTTSERMIIPGANGQNYEVSMSPSRNIFHMQLGPYEYYEQGYSQQSNGHQSDYNGVQQVGASAGYGSTNQQGNAAFATSSLQQNTGNVGLQYNQQNGAANSLAGQGSAHFQQNAGHALRYGPATVQQNGGHAGSYYGQQSLVNSGVVGQNFAHQNGGHLGQSNYANFQQNPANPAATGQSYAQQNNVAATASAYHQHSQQFSNLNNNNHKIESRIIRKCYPNGHCEYIVDDRQHQQVLQQARANIIPNVGKCNKAHGVADSGKTQYGVEPLTSKMGLRDRRLFPYSEVEIPEFPFNA